MKLHWKEMELLSNQIDQDLNLGVRTIVKVLKKLNDRELLTLIPVPETVTTTAAEPEKTQPDEPLALKTETKPAETEPAETETTTSPSSEPDPAPAGEEGPEEGSIPF